MYGQDLQTKVVQLNGWLSVVWANFLMLSSFIEIPPLIKIIKIDCVCGWGGRIYLFLQRFWVEVGRPFYNHISLDIVEVL